jgi:hypothetical protein
MKILSLLGRWIVRRSPERGVDNLSSSELIKFNLSIGLDRFPFN